MSPRLRLAALAAGVGLAAVVVALIVRADSPDRVTGSGDLRWVKAPVRVADVGRKGDVVVVGTVQNATRHELELRSADVGVLDANGSRVRAYARYAGAYVHGLYGAYPRVPRQPESELRRLGFKVRLESGQTAPLFVAFRPGPRAREPFELVYGELGRPLPVPRRARRAPGYARIEARATQPRRR